MTLLAGAALVLVSWGALVLVILGWGLPASLLSTRTGSRAIIIRRALWFGLAIGSAFLLVLSLVLPLGAPTTTWLLTGSSAIGLVLALLLSRRRTWRPARHRNRPRLLVVLSFALVATVIVLAFAVLGPVTNYDTGLYHLGAIAYGRDFAAVPGLSNLYGPLGYATLEFAWASALAGTPLAENGFRLLNGLLMVLLAIELLLRWRGVRRVGDYVLLVSAVAIWGPMLGMADFWIASPTQDAAALVLSLVLIAYFVDAIAGRPGWRNDAWTAVLIGVVLIAVRTTMIVFVLATLVVLLVIAARGGLRTSRSRTTPIVVGVAAAAIGTAMLLRDYVFSGWLLYPLSMFPMDVPWQAADPQSLRDATLGFHRDPTDIQGAIDGWAWIPGWVSRLPGYWETYLVLAFIAALILSAIVFRLTSHRYALRIPGRRILLATAPSAIALVAWFVFSPPTFRFVWGPLVGLLAIPVGWLIYSGVESPVTPRRLANGARSLLVTGAAALVLIAGIVTVTVRIPWADYTQSVAVDAPVSISYRVAPLSTPPTTVETLPEGLEVLRPIPTDQCWDVYPLCSPVFPPTLQLRGSTIEAGFRN